ncbi:hypothetical protein ACIPVK_00235 [Paeniglutamicibacter sp. MACA_103]|uniref:hypothetical protein n=1 Tax=Paeniglutamicibacter sp. MACA_103 TaxID=3377337 RepID=UPI0038944829
MKRFVIDPAALLHLANNGYRPDPGHQLVAPNSIRSAALDLLLQGVRDGEITEPQALELHELITALKIRLLGDRVSRGTAWKIAREQNGDSIRHAEYLALTLLQADALVALDPGLVAFAEGVVPLAPVTELFPETGQGSNPQPS